LNSTAKTCFLHIGAPKTGTTAVQRLLYENRVHLKSRGLLYPEVSLRGYGHHDLALLTAGSYPDWADPIPEGLDELVVRLEEQVSEHDGNIIISSENFYLFPEPEKVSSYLSSALTNHRITVIVYIRSQVEAHESWYNQTIKAQGYAHNIDKCIDDFKNLWDYDKNLSHWAKVFGRENLLVYQYGEPKHGEFEAGFLNHLGLTMEGITLSNESINQRLSRDILEFQRYVNELPIDTIKKRTFHKDLIELSQSKEGKAMFEDSPLLSDQQKRKIVDYYDDSNHRVSEEYFNHEPLFNEQAFDIDTRLPSTLQENQALSPEKLVKIFAWLMIKHCS